MTLYLQVELNCDLKFFKSNRIKNLYTSKLLHKLAYASTCSNTLILCEDYEISTQGFAQFRNDLIEAFYNCEGFKLLHKLAYASTCSNTLILCEDYEISTQGFAQFRNDLIEAFYNCEGFININANQPEIIDLESNNLSNEINSFPLYSKCNSHSSPQQPSFQMPTKDQLQHNPYIRNNSNNNGNNNVQRRYRQRQRSNNNNFEFINYSIDNYVNGNQH
ncbi:12171_t:CDS:2 [Entrophospora sp. SA101]|nr:12171_t:CDS:2 [Entrophospora sp. SA101]